MPYARNADLPAAVRDALPAEAQTVFRRALNAALETYGGDEERAFRVAWAAVRKAGWERGADGTWRRRPVRTEGSMPEQEMGEARPGFQPKFIFGRPNPRYRAGADEEEPRDEERGRSPDEFLVRPEEVKRLRQLARDGGMDDEAFAGAIRAMRRALRQTGELRFPPELRRAIEKATTEEEARDLEAALRRAATRRLRQRQAEAAEEDMPYWLYDDDPAIEEMGATEAIAKATLALGEAPRTFTSEERERYA
ncbi:MAG TPA: ChaB family protein, partial [Actinomycetota bacterium]|nr:ChaB family protein [Actinomycetota bacterium]